MARQPTNDPYGMVTRFAEAVRRKFAAHAQGEPEEQLRGPTEQLLTAIGQSQGMEVDAIGEVHLGAEGRPDFAVAVSRLTVGFIELKAPGTGADVRRFRGRNKTQAEKFLKQPNVLYSDGHQWAQYVDGVMTGELVALPGSPDQDGTAAVDEESAGRLFELLRRFLLWNPVPPSSTEELAYKLAPLCRALRDDVELALDIPGSNMRDLRSELRRLLFPEISDERFADVYAETVTFALLLARAEGADPTDLHASARALRGGHSVLGRVLEILTDDATQGEVRAPLSLLQRYIRAVDPDRLQEDGQGRLIEEVQLQAQKPWIYFYEEFLSEYDPKMRRDAGVYYTPVEVVQCQVRLVEELLRRRLGHKLGFADPGVITLDPATGTGTYLLGVIDQAAARVSVEEGVGQVAPSLSEMARRLYGFEWLVGPYAVAELRVAQALERFGARGPTDGEDGGVLLTNTLTSPHGEPPDLGRHYQVLTDEQREALRVKRSTPVLVCIGNPPYDRHDRAKTRQHYDITGAWVRWGEAEHWDVENQQTRGILRHWVEAGANAGAGRHIKNLYNLYVYFWRWAIWKVFEDPLDDNGRNPGPGIVSYITASSFLRGRAFAGMREALRRSCDEVWIIDLGGEGHGARKEPNVFAIQTPVCVTIAFRRRRARSANPAAVHYHRVRGTRSEKLQALADIQQLRDVDWETSEAGWTASFVPRPTGTFFEWPKITDLFPWQTNGVQLKRLWPIGTSRDHLERRWRALLRAPDRAVAFKESGDRTIRGEYGPLNDEFRGLPPIAELPRDAPLPPLASYAYRSFDRQHVIASSVMMARPRPPLWATYSDSQIFLSTMLSTPIGHGPALTACAAIPDLDHFRGSFGAKHQIPLYRDRNATDPNIVPALSKRFDPVSLFCYAYCVLGSTAYTRKFWDELEHCELHLPLTGDKTLFEEAVQLGRHLLWIHTYGARMVPEGLTVGEVPQGRARCVQAVPSDSDHYPVKYRYNAAKAELHIGEGDKAGLFAPIEADVWEFEVSGLKVVQSWLGYRMARRRGRRSSPLDDIHPERWTAEMSRELLNLLWILEHTLEIYPQQADLLDRILAGPLIKASDLPPPLPADHPLRKPPRIARPGQPEGLFGDEDDDDGDDEPLEDDEAGD